MDDYPWLEGALARRAVMVVGLLVYGFDTDTVSASNAAGHGTVSADLTVRFSPDAYDAIAETVPIEGVSTCPGT